MVLRVLVALHRGLADQWARSPPDARRRGARMGAVTFAALAVGAVLVLVAPWGERDTFLAVIAFCAIAMLVTLILTARSAIRESRRANARRRARSSGR